MRTNLGLTALSALLSASTVFAGGHPQTLGHPDLNRGYEWVAASRALTAGGFVKSTGVHERLRRGLEMQVQPVTMNHEFKDGDVPSSDRWCAAVDMPDSEPPISEQDGRFGSVLLMSEVAVVATLAEAIPGFYTTGNPGVLFSLSDVAPLHGHARTTGYVLIPFDRMVVSGRVFCSVLPETNLWPGSNAPEVGDRVVIMGDWANDNVVRIERSATHRGTLAQVDNRGLLRWDSTVHMGVVPGSLANLKDRANEAAVGGLFNLTAHLVLQEYGSSERREFIDTWRSYEEHYESRGCRIVGVAERHDEGLVPSDFVCHLNKKK